MLTGVFLPGSVDLFHQLTQLTFFLRPNRRCLYLHNPLYANHVLPYSAAATRCTEIAPRGRERELTGRPRIPAVCHMVK